MIKIVLVEDNETIRKGLESMINSAAGFKCAACFSDCESMLDNIKDKNPDVLLIDINLAGVSAAEGIKKVKKIFPGLVVLVLVIYMQSDKVFETICAGACGYIVKNSPPSHLLNLIKLAYKGGSPMSAQIAIKIHEYFLKKNSGKTGLNSNEKSVLNELIHGNNYKAIANKLSMNIDEVQFQFRNIYNKLHYSLNKPV
jgi:DNA-binding NarL/FixJ family response regulator